MSKIHTLSYAASAAIALVALTACGKSPEPEETAAPEEAVETTPAVETQAIAYDTLEKKVSYGIGMQMGSQLARDPSMTVDVDALFGGIQDALDGAEPAVSQGELMAAFNELRTKIEAEAQAASAKNNAAGADFLAQNAERAEVQTTESGLQYEIVSSSGSEEKPSPSNTVKVHYHGTLIDGTVFDSSVQRGEPIEFPVTGVIKGWIEGLQLMNKGDKFKFYIPADLAYGNQATGKIPAGSTLIFDVELLDIL
ncbi:FKBP-type peptidyl-prolyl cis-trans isomerase [Pelagicoccus albus]|uniref:Peptidyl-prolyl cis-trans isomerase n=1 Tax=Pelagicoccus albus TaxID=415222 RepID=A0A7X1BAG2_9BACT|nr:FKBP-type peptidyl-prolyl cis-trans isomerase [Pelagicoccus albus]MBC2607320.1 FKBP-type peptidyl-prolyl cis-trans isomerase [Pelagicoccus albus]